MYRSLLVRRWIEFQIAGVKDMMDEYASFHCYPARMIIWLANARLGRGKTVAGRYYAKHSAMYEETRQSLRLAYANILMVPRSTNDKNTLM